MNIRIFNKPYWIRRFTPQVEYKGYLSASHTDKVASLNVHPAGNETISALPEGERKIRRLEAHGEVKLLAANQETGVRGDLLLYHGDWYECVSCVYWDHTLLTHYNYEFVIVPSAEAKSDDLKDPPTEDPAFSYMESEDEW